jgi:hypothetical protein
MEKAIQTAEAKTPEETFLQDTKNTSEKIVDKANIRDPQK